MRIYISGCGGMLGEAFYQQFKTNHELKCTDIDVNEQWLDFCDIRNHRQYYTDVLLFKPDYLFHLGAHTDLEFCELNPERTHLTNVESVKYAVDIANKLEIPILYISTAGIFDGKKDVYDDWDIPNPLGVYAKTKHEGEVYVKENANKHLICRASWMVGGGPRKDKTFINKLMRQIKEGKRILHIVNDKRGTITYTHDFALNTEFLIKEKFFGLFNMASRGITSRLEIAKELISILGMGEEIEIAEVPSDYFKNDYFAPRPDSERLVNKKLDNYQLNFMRHWKVVLQEYISFKFKDYL